MKKLRRKTRLETCRVTHTDPGIYDEFIQYIPEVSASRLELRKNYRLKLFKSSRLNLFKKKRSNTNIEK